MGVQFAAKDHFFFDKIDRFQVLRALNASASEEKQG